jgi:hypothetical protein
MIRLAEGVTAATILKLVDDGKTAVLPDQSYR